MEIIFKQTTSTSFTFNGADIASLSPVARILAASQWYGNLPGASSVASDIRLANYADQVPINIKCTPSFIQLNATSETLIPFELLSHTFNLTFEFISNSPPYIMEGKIKALTTALEGLQVGYLITRDLTSATTEMKAFDTYGGQSQPIITVPNTYSTAQGGGASTIYAPLAPPTVYSFTISVDTLAGTDFDFTQLSTLLAATSLAWRLRINASHSTTVNVETSAIAAGTSIYLILPDPTDLNLYQSRSASILGGDILIAPSSVPLLGSRAFKLDNLSANELVFNGGNSGPYSGVSGGPGGTVSTVWRQAVSTTPNPRLT